MTMTTEIGFHDALHHLAQAGETAGVRLVRLTALDEANRYTARPVEFASDGSTEFVGEETVTVTNLAEPADADGSVAAGTDAVAVDVEGRWVVFVRQAGAAVFPARVVSSQGGAAYSVLEQVATGAGTFADKQGAEAVAAHNLAELSLGPGAAVDDDTIVFVTTLEDTGTPPTLRYVFDHPVYAKYLS
jgi:hypothetical protein